MQDGEDAQSIAAEVNAWMACEERLSRARTWPYNTEIIGKLLISILMPIGIELVMKLIGRLF